ncbi:F0F1 ATP synthase subunit gamma, partial [Bacillus altitudinis]|uniref:F0F1 ATP synthase subunit gamma n=1 Tax=Bacillus altitudinis TaxID=293387 RepID=UPI0016427630
GRRNKRCGCYEFEACEEEIVEVVLGEYGESLILGAVVDRKGSEDAARMRGMKSGREKAKELIDGVRLCYNRAGQ